MNREINWGPEIVTRGVKPTMRLAAGKWQWREFGSIHWITAYGHDGDGYEWTALEVIRLPADHPHYATLSRATAQNGGEVGPEVVERMIACLRAAAAVAKDSVFGQSGYASEARAIVALLPEPVDPLLEKVKVSIRGRGDHDVSLGELSRLINGGARITGIRALEKEAGR